MTGTPRWANGECWGRGGPPTHVAQNAPHDALIILRHVSWGGGIFLKENYSGPLRGAGGESSLACLDQPLWTGLSQEPLSITPLSFGGLERPPPRANPFSPSPAQRHSVCPQSLLRLAILTQAPQTSMCTYPLPHPLIQPPIHSHTLPPARSLARSQTPHRDCSQAHAAASQRLSKANDTSSSKPKVNFMLMTPATTIAGTTEVVTSARRQETTNAITAPASKLTAACGRMIQRVTTIVGTYRTCCTGDRPVQMSACHGASWRTDPRIRAVRAGLRPMHVHKARQIPPAFADGLVVAVQTATATPPKGAAWCPWRIAKMQCFSINSRIVERLDPCPSQASGNAHPGH